VADDQRFVGMLVQLLVNPSLMVCLAIFASENAVDNRFNESSPVFGLHAKFVIDFSRGIALLARMLYKIGPRVSRILALYKISMK